ncbi:hypothetical protein JEQ12_018916 [Ovis aries]|uniref:Uncharacterized protein n=1 Tax=Ovis aries TaxID=9940 RepID=A0A836D3B2_SHEEP|nr:hypothetical protein JEQ12_018916 [Ovis aries]
MKASGKTKENQDEKRPKPVFQESSSLYPNLIDLETELSPPPYADPNPPLLPQFHSLRILCKKVHGNDCAEIKTVMDQKEFAERLSRPPTMDVSAKPQDIEAENDITSLLKDLRSSCQCWEPDTRKSWCGFSVYQ